LNIIDSQKNFIVPVNTGLGNLNDTCDVCYVNKVVIRI